MDTGKYYTRLKEQIAELSKKLSTSQKITMALICVLVAGSMILLVMLSRGDTHVRLFGSSDLDSVHSMQTLFDKHGIPYRIGADGAIEVPRDQASRARWLAAESGIAAEKDSNLNWLFGEGSLIDTPSRLRSRLLESRKMTVVDAIRWGRNIQNARIVLRPGPKPIYANQDRSSDSAAVAVALRPGVEGLTQSEAAAIRTLVSGAFNIPPQNIQLVDDKPRSYPYVEGTALGLSEDEDRTRKVVLSTIQGLLGRIYRPQEFVVGVLVDISARSSQRESISYNPDQVATGEVKNLRETETRTRPRGSPVGVDPNVKASGGLGGTAYASLDEVSNRDKREVTSENRFSSVKEKVAVPPGELRGISVNVVLDRGAVRRVLQEEELTRLTPARREKENIQTQADITNFTVNGKLGQNNLDDAIEWHRVSQETFLKNQIPMSGAAVNVSAVMFPQPEMPGELVASREAIGWLARHWSELLLGLIALLGLLLLYRMFRHAVPPPLDIPALDESALEEEKRASEEELRKLETEIAENKTRLEEMGAGNLDPLSDTVEAVNTLAQSNPEAASSVLRMWMAIEDEKE